MSQSRSALRKPRANAGDWLVTGSIASLLSAVMLGACGWRQNGTATTPLNGPSQWLWGTGAARSRKLDVRHTAAGYLIHHASSLMWAGVHHRLFGARQVGPGRAAVQGLVTAAMAAFVDYRVTPRRFQPGFEHHVSRTSLALVYGAFGIALGLAHRSLSAPRDRKPRGH